MQSPFSDVEAEYLRRRYSLNKELQGQMLHQAIFDASYKEMEKNFRKKKYFLDPVKNLSLQSRG